MLSTKRHYIKCLDITTTIVVMLVVIPVIIFDRLMPY